MEDDYHKQELFEDESERQPDCDPLELADGSSDDESWPSQECGQGTSSSDDNDTHQMRPPGARASNAGNAVGAQMPWFEARFTDMQRLGWAAAEALAGIKHEAGTAIRKPASKKGGGQGGALAFKEGFAPCETIAGSDVGRHCYRQGEHGLGYY